MNSNCYKNNPNLKAAHVEIDLTKREFDEYLKCSNDPVYFAENYVKIVNVDLGLIDFHPRDYQYEMLDTFHDNRFTICKMARQTGKSTTVIAYFLWFILFNPDKSVGILANKQSLAIDIMDRLKLAYEHLPWFLQQGVMVWNKKKIELENGSKCMAGSTSSSSVRGMTFNAILLDEFAHIKGQVAEEFFESVYPTISSGKESKIIIVSTPKGMNMFYKLWIDSMEGKNNYARVEVHWSQVPGRDEKWKRETIENTSQRQFDQEHECLFLGSDNTLISGHKLRSLASVEPLRRLSTVHTDDRLNIYEEPVEGRAYALTVDVSEGVGLDYSALSVFDITEFPYKQVATYRSNKISELMYPDVIWSIGTFYNNATVLVENNFGREVANTLEIDLGYENIVSVGSDKRMGQIASGGFGGKTANGVKMTKSVKRIGCTTLKSLVESDRLLVNDEATINELKNFVEVRGSYAAGEDGNDDLAMTLVLFAWLSVQDYFKELSDLDVRAKMLAEKEDQKKEELLPFYNSQKPEHMESFQTKDGDIWEPVGDDEGVMGSNYGMY